MLQLLDIYKGSLQEIESSKKLINTINAHSFNTYKKDPIFRQAIEECDLLLPDGISVVMALRLLKGEKIKKIAGFDLFKYEMERVNSFGGKCFFLGSTVKTLEFICNKAKSDYPELKIFCYSPPFKPNFSDEDCSLMINAINEVEPDVLFVGMTAPKQEKWAHKYFQQLNALHVCCIGAVFDFYAGTVKRAPKWMISAGLEWMYRLLSEPKRLWRRYLIGNTIFVVQILKEKLISKKIKTGSNSTTLVEVQEQT